MGGYGGKFLRLSNDNCLDLVVGDLSFISLGLVLPALTACAAGDADLLPMVKPQFEVGRERLGAGGVVRDPEHNHFTRLSLSKVVPIESDWRQA